MEDAALGFFRSSLHKLVLEIRVSARAHVSHRDTSLFASVKEYLAIEKGWFSPYLFASSRRPIIPRVMTPDVIFCHGPFLAGFVPFRFGDGWHWFTIII
jgi:hypothetical protein